MPRTYERKFDWDEARRLRKTGLTLRAIAERLGVSSTAILLAVNPQQRAKHAAYTQALQRSGTCDECGKQCSWNKSERGDRPVLCRSCANRKAQTRFLRDEAGRIIAVRCSRCRLWKPLEGFYRHEQASETIRARCKDCDNTARVAWREANREHERAYARDRQRRRRNESS